MWCFWKQFLSFPKHNGMLQAKQMTNVQFLYSPLHSARIVLASFANLVDVLHGYQSIQVGYSS